VILINLLTAGHVNCNLVCTLQKIGKLEIEVSLAKPPSENKKKEQRKREQERQSMMMAMRRGGP
jgi:hypothetical protein